MICLKCKCLTSKQQNSEQNAAQLQHTVSQNLKIEIILVFLFSPHIVKKQAKESITDEGDELFQMGNKMLQESKSQKQKLE